jgi:stearoyl-CoA desaturase (delta-9 desaturase)
LTLSNHSSLPDNPQDAAAREKYAADFLTLRITVLSVVIVPFIGFIAALAFLWGKGIGWTELGVTIVMYVLTVLGITIGFHRLFTHRAFETNRVVQGILAILGSMAVQGPLLKWVAMHRCHHQFSDKTNDPHSPYENFHGFFGVLRGAWHSHIGWFFTPDPPGWERYVKDLRRSRLLRHISDWFPLWVLLGLMIPAIAGGLITQTWMGVLYGFVWGGLARVFLVHHVTWSVNSICHIWGRQTYKTHDQSKNNFIMGVLALGEGWHNNHHAFPSSARHGLRWWQVDVSYLIIRCLGILRLAHKIKLPAPQKNIAFHS